MLAVSSLRSSNLCEIAGDAAADDFSVEFDFDFSELFAGIEDGEVLPGLDVEGLGVMLTFPSPETVAVEVETVKEASGCGGGAQPEEMVSVKDKEAFSSEIMEEASTEMETGAGSSATERERGRRPSARHVKGSNGKKKMKVDWTPELHRQFVQAVEQLGVDKAVPSKILELMGIDCLTRHNIASHLQKYRSHRKHMLVREAEATSWSQRRQAYTMPTTTTTTTTPGNIIVPTREGTPWLVQTMGFPPHPLPYPHTHLQTFRPLHVWGHPSSDQSLVHLWPPKHLFPMSSSPWVAPHPPFRPPTLPYASPWNSHLSREGLIHGTPYLAQQVPTLRFPAPQVAGIPPHPMYRPGEVLPTATPPSPTTMTQTGWQLQHDAHPSKESIDAVIGEVLAQPWLPVPLGLKPPSLESVLAELQKQGISVVPPCSSLYPPPRNH